MGGGGKGGGGGGQVPKFVTDAQKEIGGRSQEQFDIQRPLLQAGAQQLQSILNTGGPGARVPSITNAINAQNSALANTQRSVGANLDRGGITGPLADRLNNQVTQQGAITANGIAPNIAAPLALANINNALSSGQNAQAGFSAGLNALNAGRRTQIPSQSGLGAGRNIANALLFGGNGGFQGFGGKGANTANPFGSGISPTGGFIRGTNGILGGGV